MVSQVGVQYFLIRQLYGELFHVNLEIMLTKILKINKKWVFCTIKVTSSVRIAFDAEQIKLLKWKHWFKHVYLILDKL